MTYLTEEEYMRRLGIIRHNLRHLNDRTIAIRMEEEFKRKYRMAIRDRKMERLDALPLTPGQRFRIKSIIDKEEYELFD